MRRRIARFSGLEARILLEATRQRAIQMKNLGDLDLHDGGLSLGGEGLNSWGMHAALSTSRSALALTSALGSRESCSPGFICRRLSASLVPEQLHPRVEAA